MIQQLNSISHSPAHGSGAVVTTMVRWCDQVRVRDVRCPRGGRGDLRERGDDPDLHQGAAHDLSVRELQERLAELERSEQEQSAETARRRHWESELLAKNGDSQECARELDAGPGFYCTTNVAGAWNDHRSLLHVQGCRLQCVSVVAVKGGKVPIDAGSLVASCEHDDRFEESDDIAAFKNTQALDQVKIQVMIEDIDCILLAVTVTADDDNDDITVLPAVEEHVYTICRLGVGRRLGSSVACPRGAGRRVRRRITCRCGADWRMSTRVTCPSTKSCTAGTDSRVHALWRPRCLWQPTRLVGGNAEDRAEDLRADADGGPSCGWGPTGASAAEVDPLQAQAIVEESVDGVMGAVSAGCYDEEWFHEADFSVPLDQACKGTSTRYPPQIPGGGSFLQMYVRSPGCRWSQRRNVQGKDEQPHGNCN